MTLGSFKTKLLSIKNIKTSSFIHRRRRHVEAIKDSSSFETQEDDSVEGDEEPTTVEYSSVPVEHHLAESETELVLTTTTTFPAKKEDLVLPAGMLPQCTKVHFEENAEIVLNTINDLSHCTSVLIEQQGNKPSETEMVLTTATLKTISEEEIQEQEMHGEATIIPEVVPASDDDFIVVLTDNNMDETKIVQEVHDNVEDSLLADDDKSQDNEPILFKMKTKVNRTTSTSSQKFRSFGKSARPSPRLVPRGNYRGMSVESKQQQESDIDFTKPVVDSMSQWGRQLDGDGEEEHKDDEQQQDTLSSLLLMLPTLSNSKQHEMLMNMILGATTTTTTNHPPPTNVTIVHEDDDDATTSVNTGAALGPPSTICLESSEAAQISTLTILQETLVEAGVDQQMVLLAQALDPSQLGHLVANNDWLQQKAKEKAGIQEHEFRQIMGDLLFL